MTAAFSYKDKDVWASNGQVEDMLVALIKFAPDNSRLLQLCIDQYRCYYSGIVVFLHEAIETEDEKNGWKVAIKQSLDHIQSCQIWTDVGKKWILDNRDALVKIVD